MAVHRNEADPVTLLVAMLRVGVHLEDQSVHFLVNTRADVLHQVVNAPLASLQRCGRHDEVFCVDIFGS